MPGDDSTTIRVSQDNYRRLSNRGDDIDAGSFDDVIGHLLDVTEEELTLQETIDRGVEYFNGMDSIVSIYANHPTHDEDAPEMIDLVFHTEEADTLEDSVETINSHHKVVVETDDGQVRAPVSARGTFGGPKDIDNKHGTPLYMKNVIGTEDHVLEDGIERLKTKFRGEAEEWRPTLRDQYHGGE